jgi:murein DD-endopeptidase MepM/ murein hydrolase activator NlpD
VNNRPGGHDSRARHWLIDAVVGGGLALGLITVANAALPRLERTRPEQPATARILPRPVARPAAPAALIAFQEPAPGYPVISPFGMRKLPWEEAGRLHAGVDIAGPPGDPVLAAADGVVTRLAVDPGYGRFVEVQHAGGLVTRYGHLARYEARIRPGLTVRGGQALGAMGSTGSSTGSHLHFEIRDAKGRPLNPEMFLGRSFASAADLPLKAAARLPRGVRVAYVSRIPRAKREAMEARVQLAAAADAAQAGGDEVAPNALDAAADAADSAPPVTSHRRPHATFRPHAGG